MRLPSPVTLRIRAFPEGSNPPPLAVLSILGKMDVDRVCEDETRPGGIGRIVPECGPAENAGYLPADGKAEAVPFFLLPSSFSKRLNTISCLPSGMPGPVSVTEKSTSPCASSTSTPSVILPGK